MCLMRDRQKFDTVKLSNGIEVLMYPEDVGFADLRIVLPVGHVHNCGNILPGTAHFLEHIVCERSNKNPIRNQFIKNLMLKGGDFDACTSRTITTYEIVAIESDMHDISHGLFDLVFDPLFNPDDIASHRGIISSERSRRRWYPGVSEGSQYVNTEWFYNVQTTLRQNLGDDEDLAQMNSQNLRLFHGQGYFDPRIKVFVAGSFDADDICKLFSQLKTKPHSFGMLINPVYWKKREFHTRGFQDANRFLYLVAGFCNQNMSIADRYGLHFLLTYLCNITHGPLFEWLRQEKGWVYEIKRYFDESVFNGVWKLELPMQSMDQVEVVRKELHEKITVALNDIDRIVLETQRRINLQQLSFKTIHSVLNSAIEEFEVAGVQTTQEEARNYHVRCREKGYLLDIYERYFASRHLGEFCGTPLEKEIKSDVK
jgi:predicted Zn-dependent peptidase